MRFRRGLLGVMGVAVAAALVTRPAVASDGPSGKRVAPFALKDSNGDLYDASQHVGRDVMIIAFWATWCHPCKIELAALHPIYQKYRGQGLVMLAVSIDGPDSIAEVSNYKRKYGYTFPVLLDSETALLERYNPRGDVPFSIIVDRNGNVVDIHQGYNPGDEKALEAEIVALLAEKPAVAAGDAVLADEAVGQWRWDLPAHVEGTESFQARYLADNENGSDKDDQVFGIINRLTLGASAGPLTLGIRTDNVAYPGYNAAVACEGESLANCPWVDDHRIERLWLQYRTPSLAVRAGDFYGSIGRGLTFSVRKIDELGLDTSVRGGRATGQLGPVTLTGFGGLGNVRNVDVEKDGFIEDPDDVVAGGELRVDLPYKMTLAARGTYIDYKETEAPDAFRKQDQGDWTVGGSFEMRDIAKAVTVYVEGAFLRNLNKVDSKQLGSDVRKIERRDADGHALYASVSAAPAEGLTLLLEFKWYERFQIRKPTPDKQVPVVYHEAPTLERYDQIVQYTAHALGGRLLAEYFVKPLGVLVTANGLYYGWARDEEFAYDEPVAVFGDRGLTTLHAYLGIEKRWEGGYFASFTGGYRLETPNAITPGEPDFNRKLWHVDGDVQIPLAGKYSVGMRGQMRQESQNKGGHTKEFVRGDLGVTWGLGPDLSVSLLWTFQTEFPNQEEFKNFAAEVVWKFSDWGQWSVFGGQNTGGLICVSGVCRNFPSFFGVRSDLIARF